MNIEEYRKSLEDYRAYDRSGQELTHWGISGMKWGRRRWQNQDGSLTEEGRIHYGVGAAREAAKNEARVIKAQAKAKAYEEKQKVKMAVKEAKGMAEAEAIKLKAEKQHLVDQAKEDRKAVEAQADAETKNRKVAASVEKLEEKNRHKENSVGKKLLIGAGAIIGATILIKAWRGKEVSSLPKTDSSKAKAIIDKLKDERVNSLKTKLDDVTAERDLYKDNYGAAQDMLYGIRNAAAKAFKAKYGVDPD